MNPPLVVSVGMTHPQNVAGIGLDIRIAADYCVRHTIVVAAVSAQDEHGVQRVVPMPAEFVLDQIRAAGMREAAAVRIGALGNSKNIEVLQDALCDQQVVVDPVTGSSAGGSLYLDDPVAHLANFSAGATTIITPNIPEAAQMSGMRITTPDDMIAAGRHLLRSGADVVLVKGGHLRGDPVDVLVTRDGVERFADTRLPGKMRGTGCTLAMALACELALGRDLVDAVKGARAYVRAKIARP